MADASAIERRGNSIVGLVVAVLLLSPLATVFNNTEPIPIGPLTLPSLRLYDAMGMISTLLLAIIPFFLAWRHLRSVEAQTYVLKAFVIAGLLYSLPVLFEVRMSPQLHTWIYGFFPYDFGQHMRQGGFRPVVFLGHGLMLGTFYCPAALSALLLWREALRSGMVSTGWLYAFVALIGVLVLSKNLGALIITISFAGLIMFGGRRLIVYAAVLVATVLILYPALRASGLVPTSAILSIAQAISEDRAGSLEFRLINEDALMARANEKPSFGWGNWGRNQIYNPDTGRMMSVTDGLWIILIGIYGWFGYVAHFALLTIAIWISAIRRSALGTTLVTPGLMMLLSASLIDLIPNGWLLAHVWLIAGSLTGAVLRGTAASPEEATIAPTNAILPEAAVRGTGPGWLMQGGSPRAARSARQATRRPGRTR